MLSQGFQFVHELVDVLKFTVHGGESNIRDLVQLVQLLHDFFTHNVQRHAKATRVSIALEIHLEMLRVTIIDNGVGFDMEVVLRDPEKWDHFGIKGILERARLVGGEGHITSKKGRGTKIVVEVPLVNKEATGNGED